jgi:hypothetical protein
MLRPRNFGAVLGAVLGAALSGCAFQVGPDAVTTDRAQGDAQVNLPGGAPDALGPSDENDPGPGGPGDSGAPGDETSQPSAPLPPWDSSQPFTGARDGRIAGTIGPAAGFDLPTDIANVYDDGYYTQIEVFALRSDGRRVMLALQVQTDGEDGPFFVPGVGKRMKLGYTTAGYVGALACEGPDSGDPSEPFGDTPFDEEPCEVGVDTEQDPENPANVLRVTVQAVFADANGDCPEEPGAGVGDGDFGEEDLPDFDGDGDGDLCDDDEDPSDPINPPSDPEPSEPEPTEPTEPGSGGGVNPLTATATFSMTR